MIIKKSKLSTLEFKKVYKHINFNCVLLIILFFLLFDITLINAFIGDISIIKFVYVLISVIPLLCALLLLSDKQKNKKMELGLKSDLTSEVYTDEYVSNYGDEFKLSEPSFTPVNYSLPTLDNIQPPKPIPPKIVPPPFLKKEEEQQENIFTIEEDDFSEFNFDTNGKQIAPSKQMYREIETPTKEKNNVHIVREQLKILRNRLANGEITREEFETERARLIDSLD